MALKKYIKEIDSLLKAGNATEHSYRPALKVLLETLLPKLTITNEPKRCECGAPDYIITKRSGEPVFFVEAKDIGDSDLSGRRQHREQFERYRQSLDHVIFTDYLDFHLYKYGEFVDSVRIGDIRGGRVVLLEENMERFVSLIAHTGDARPQRISSPQRLATIMAAKTRLLADTIERALDDKTESYSNTQLQAQYRAFRSVLISDISAADFADMYAQTITYGLFAARLHDKTPRDFSRAEAASLIPKTNPLLRQIFLSIAGYDLDDRIAWIVDDLVSSFGVVDLQELMADYKNDALHHDPMIHFYEDFLAAFDPSTRKAKGVWYTPQSVVQFIVRSVDEILQREFGLQLGLADYSTVQREVSLEGTNDHRTNDGLKHINKTYHRVQILDPATGTGTFLAEVIQQIHDKFRSQQGMWQDYVEHHLVPRINGFELLMASYAIAHLKLDMVLQQTGYEHRSDKRLNIYLTNSLEEAGNTAPDLFAQYLTAEANQANMVKRDNPVMVMVGNPPYSVSSQNNGGWITQLVGDYKQNLNERNIQPLSDDYIKFIRLGQHYIDKTGEGILSFISNNSYLDGVIHRQMRYQLLRAFDEIYILDLHGNTRKKETAPDGSKDENVFDIMQGVAIAIFVKSGKKKKGELGRVFHSEIYGRREAKYDYLANNSLSDIAWTELEIKEPYFFFVPKDFSKEEEYNKGFKLDELFLYCVCGLVTSKDKVNVRFSKEEAEQLAEDFKIGDVDFLRRKYDIGEDTRDWSLDRAKLDIVENYGLKKIAKYLYRPFDIRYIVHTGKTNGLVAWPRGHSLDDLLLHENIALLVCKQQSTYNFQHVFVVREAFVDKCTNSSQTKEATYVFKLFNNVGEADSILKKNGAVRPNFNDDIYNKVCAALGERPEPERLFFYIYAILHSEKYRERYKEFLKIDFPRVPYPTDKEKFEALAHLGKQLADIHLLKNSNSWAVDTTFPMAGNGEVGTISYRKTTEDSKADNRVYINETQYFGNVPEQAWNAYIGGYQPAQKWLKDRKGRQLSFDDIRHYEEIIHALIETKRLMEEVDKIYDL